MSCLKVLAAFHESILLEQEEDLEALHDMVARRNPPGDVRNLPSLQMLFLNTVQKRLISLCSDRGVTLEYVEDLGYSKYDVNEYVDIFQ